MSIQNNILDSIKSAQTKELKVDLAIEYFKYASDNMSRDKVYILDIHEIIEIIDCVGKEFNNKTNISLNKVELSEILYIVQSIKKEYINSTYTREVIMAEEILSYRLLKIFEGIKNNNYNVYLKDSFNEISEALKSINMRNNKNPLNIKTRPFTLKSTNRRNTSSFRSDNPWCEYNLKPEDDGYEFSISEALDNMYGK